MNHFLTTKDLVLIALFCALTIVLGLIPPIPMPGVPVPVTLQTFGVMLAGLILGPKRAGLVLLLYVGIAMIGIPVLPGGRAGLAVLAGPTGGFLLGMIPGAVVTAVFAGSIAQITHVPHDPKTSSTSHASHTSHAPGTARTFVPPVRASLRIVRYGLAAMVGGVLVVYACGIPWLAAMSGMPVSKAFWIMLVFIPGDTLKCIIAALIAERVRRLNLT